MLTLSEIEAISNLMDLGIRSLGLAICQDGRAATIQSAADKLNAMAVAARAAEAAAAKSAEETN